MSKASKQKSKKSKTKQRQGQRQPKLHIEPVNAVAPLDSGDPEQLSAQLLEAAAAADAGDTKPELAADVDLETATEEESLLVTKPTAAENLRAALAAKQKEQPKGWKQQVKAGKMVGAHVPKRFNRGG
ncbi:MAG: hypothetical protein R2932_06270 [Caldilineaceae bacterium]